MPTSNTVAPGTVQLGGRPHVMLGIGGQPVGAAVGRGERPGRQSVEGKRTGLSTQCSSSCRLQVSRDGQGRSLSGPLVDTSGNASGASLVRLYANVALYGQEAAGVPGTTAWTATTRGAPAGGHVAVADGWPLTRYTSVAVGVEPQLPASETTAPGAEHAGGSGQVITGADGHTNVPLAAGPG